MTDRETIVSTSLGADGRLTLAIYEKHSERGPGQCIFKRELEFHEVVQITEDGFQYCMGQVRNLGV